MRSLNPYETGSSAYQLLVEQPYESLILKQLGYQSAVHILLAILKTTKDPTGLTLQEVAILISLDGEDPSSCHPVLGVNLATVYKIKHFIIKPGLDFGKLGFLETLIIFTKLRL